jgi:D-alanyl-D-alanine carboxypeptidase/D-alanyl-D-alanine-endopeptidase (penicillin-binding protein 4)
MRNNSPRHIPGLIRTKQIIRILLSLGVSLSLGPVNAWQQPRQIPQTSSSRPAAAVQQPSPTPLPTPSSSPQASPSATPAAIPLKTATTTKTLSELQARIAEVLGKPELAQALVAVKVTSLVTGRVLFEENAVKLLRPASNMKVYTVAAALDRLSPDYRYVTSVYAPARPDAAGVIHGDLTIYGRGDPSLAARFNNGDYFKAIDDLANRIVAAGVKRVEGDLIGDESYFVGPQYGSGWEWEDLTWYYGAEVSALTVNDNALDLFVKPGLEAGSKALITTGPPDPLLTIINQVTTGMKGSRRDLTIHRELGKDVLTVSGSIAVDDHGYTGGVGISHPALLFVYLLRASLAQKGVLVSGKSRTIGAASQTLLTAGTTIISAGNGRSTKPPESVRTEIANLQSPPFRVIAAQTLKPSQNLYTELILRTLGKSVPLTNPPANSVRTSEDAGLEVIKMFLRSAGIRPESLVLSDGSGLSRDDMITADATVQLLAFMSQHPHGEVFRAALPVAGVDGTLRNRMKGTVAENNVRAKTGSLSSAASLAGYVTTAAGEQLAFAIMVNNYPRDVDARALCIDPIAILLASFAAKSE